MIIGSFGSNFIFLMSDYWYVNFIFIQIVFIVFQWVIIIEIVWISIIFLMWFIVRGEDDQGVFGQVEFI